MHFRTFMRCCADDQIFRSSLTPCPGGQWRLWDTGFPTKAWGAAGHKLQVSITKGTCNDVL